MGTVSTPGVPRPAIPTTPPVDPVEASPEGPPTTPTRPIKLPPKKVPLGPRLSTIFGSVALLAVVVWLLLRPPQRVPVISLPRYVAFEANIEQGSPLDCSSPACLLVIVGANMREKRSIESAVELARSLDMRGVQTNFVLTGAPLRECATVARLFRRPVLLDPDGTLKKALEIARLPFWIVHEPSGKILRRGQEPPTEEEIAREAGL